MQLFLPILQRPRAETCTVVLPQSNARAREGRPETRRVV